MPRVLAAFLALFIAGCAGRSDLDAERRAILEADKSWASAAAAKDVERVLSYWTDDAMVFPPGQPVVKGKAALRAFVMESFKIPGFAIRWETKEVTVAKSGDLATGVGTNEVTMTGPDGTPQTSAGRAVAVWRKEPGGVWRCAIDIWNSGAPDSLGGSPPAPSGAPAPAGP
jgi:uncharacterized protein (TIGR02246 family)